MLNLRVIEYGYSASQFAYVLKNEEIAKQYGYTFIESGIDTFEDCQVILKDFLGERVTRAPDRDLIVVSFRGTESILDIVADTNIQGYRLYDGCIIHSGIARQFASIREKLRQALLIRISMKNLIGRNVHILFTGHSLGGAIATVAAGHFGRIFQRHESVSMSLITFGSPRCVDHAFNQIRLRGVDIEITRIAAPTDPVPLLPLNPLYFHADETDAYLNSSITNPGAPRILKYIGTCVIFLHRILVLFCRILYSLFVPWIFDKLCFPRHKIRLSFQDHRIKKYGYW